MWKRVTVSTPSRPSPGSELLPCPFCGGEAESQAKEPEASGGLCTDASHAVRLGEASADLPTTSEHMDVTAGETAPNSPSRTPAATAQGSAENVFASCILALYAARDYIGDDNNPRSNRVLQRIKNALDALAGSQTPAMTGPLNDTMPSSLNDACRRLDIAQERIQQLEGQVENSRASAIEECAKIADEMAAAQKATNKKYPDHANSYVTWRNAVHCYQDVAKQIRKQNSSTVREGK
jgi:hypothetical protein